MFRAKYILFFLVIAINAYSSEYDKLWGIERQEFAKNLSPESDYEVFKPEEKPEYNNRIFSFFKSMGGSGFDIKVLRVKGKPEKDYCFFNDRLYSVSEDWGETSSKNSDNILDHYHKEYNKPQVESKESMTVYTFSKDKTRILIYKKASGHGRVRLRVFHYTNEVFSMLLKD